MSPALFKSIWSLGQVTASQAILCHGRALELVEKSGDVQAVRSELLRLTACIAEELAAWSLETGASPGGPDSDLHEAEAGLHAHYAEALRLVAKELCGLAAHGNAPPRPPAPVVPIRKALP